MTPIETIVSKIAEYLLVPSVVGYEGAFIKKLEEDFQGLGLKTKMYDKLLVIEGKDPLSHMMSIHIDRHGLLANGKGELEYAAFDVNRDTYGIKTEVKKEIWEQISERFNGEMVYAYDPSTGKDIARGTIDSGYFCPIRKNFVFISKSLADLPLNTPISFEHMCTVAGDSITGQLDNVVSSAIAYAMFANGYEGSVLCTSEEEIGRSWQHVLNYFNEADITTKELFVLDTSPFDKDSDIDTSSIILRYRDNNGTFNKDLTESLIKKCDTEGVPHFFKDVYLLEQARKKGDDETTISLGNTELGRIITNSDGKITGTTIQVPTRGYHSNKEEATYKAFENVFKILHDTLVLKK
jgi:putative aminopeptidase FrvX